MKQAATTKSAISYIPFSDVDYCIKLEIQIITLTTDDDKSNNNNNNKYFYFPMKYKNKNNNKREYRNYLVTAIHIYPYEKCEEQSFYPCSGNEFFSSSDIVEILLLRKNTDYIVTNDKTTSKILRHVIILDTDNSHLFLWKQWSSSSSSSSCSFSNDMKRKLVIWEFLNMNFQQLVPFFRRVINFNKMSKKAKFVAPKTIRYNRKHVKIPALNNNNNNIIIRVIKPTISLNISLPLPASASAVSNERRKEEEDIGKLITSTYNQMIFRVKKEEEQEQEQERASGKLNYYNNNDVDVE